MCQHRTIHNYDGVDGLRKTAEVKCTCMELFCFRNNGRKMDCDWKAVGYLAESCRRCCKGRNLPSYSSYADRLGWSRPPKCDINHIMCVTATKYRHLCPHYSSQWHVHIIVTCDSKWHLCCAPECRPRSCRVPTAAASRRRITRCRNVQLIARPTMSSVCAAAKRCTCPVG